MEPMRLWVCTDHETHWPVGGGSIVMATSEDDARRLLIAALAKEGLRAGQPFTLKELAMDKPFAFVVCNGEY